MSHWNIAFEDCKKLCFQARYHHLYDKNRNFQYLVNHTENKILPLATQHYVECEKDIDSNKKCAVIYEYLIQCRSELNEMMMYDDIIPLRFGSKR